MKTDEGLQRLVHEIHRSSHAQICLLSEIHNDWIEPLVLSGTTESDFHDASLPEIMLHYLLNKSLKPHLHSVADLANASVLQQSAKLSEITQYIQIPCVDGSGCGCLISLFFAQSQPIDEQQFRSIVERIGSFQDECIEVLRRLHGQSRAFHTQNVQNLVFRSPAHRKIIDQIPTISSANSNVLIFGESGTGKELIARSIHQQSPRKNADFIAVDCVAIPSNLIESELFGHEKGAFTGAAGLKHGLLEFADGGTLFLDEISELDFNLQSKLLRVLQERQFRRVGGQELISVDIRIIAAMNRKPIEAIRNGSLRKDLYYRLNVIPIHLPPLRKRTPDIPLLANYFLRQAVTTNKLQPKGIAWQAMQRLRGYRWPGNVRQLENLIQRLALLTKDFVIRETDLPRYIRAAPLRQTQSPYDLPFNKAKQKHLDSFERRYFRCLLKKTGYDISRAAIIAGVSQRTIYRVLERHASLKRELQQGQPSS